MTDVPATLQSPAFHAPSVRRVYADAGCILTNPSPYGGTFAVVLCDAVDEPIFEFSGRCEAAPPGTVENNLMETLAVLTGLELMPDGWDGVVLTDNLNALRRADKPRTASFDPPAEFMRERLAYCRDRMPAFTLQLLCGHPTRAELETGKGKRGYPVSRHNVRCHHLLTEEARRYAVERGLT